MCVWRVRHFLWPPLQKQEEEEGERRGFWHREIKASSSSSPSPYYFSIRFIEWQRLTTTKQNLFIYPPFFGSLVRPLLFCPKFDGRFRKQTFPATLRFPYIFLFFSLARVDIFLPVLGGNQKVFFLHRQRKMEPKHPLSGRQREKNKKCRQFFRRIFCAKSCVAALLKIMVPFFPPTL